MIPIPPDAPLLDIPRTVAIFDVLGIKEGIESGRAADLAQRYRDRIRLIQLLGGQQPILDAQVPSLFRGAKVGDPTLHVFSDTIILISADDSLAACMKTLIASWRLLQSFMTGNLPLRGAVAFGDLFVDQTNQIHVGPALMQAHLVESSQAWAGAIIDASVTDRHKAEDFDNLGFPGLFDNLFPISPVPFKQFDSGARKIGVDRRATRIINWRANLVFDVGLANAFLEYHGASDIHELHPYIQEALAFAKTHRGYLEPENAIPIECRTFWVGRTPPPFPNGDEY